MLWLKMDFQAKINELRKKGIQNFQTNYFMNELDEKSIYFENDNAVTVLQKEKTFHKLYYAFYDLSAFEELLTKLPNKEIYLEIISRKEIDVQVKNVIENFFTYQTTYQKLYKKLTLTENKIFQKYHADRDLIYQKLYSTFDIRFEHVMEKNEIQELIDKNQIITIYENNELKSFIIYKIQGNKAYLNQIANYGNKDNLINLWKLFYQELNNKGITYVDLWYNKLNKKAENMYKIEQFQPLNMFNFCYKKI